MEGARSAGLSASDSHCIGCPAGGSSGAAAIIVGLLLVLVGGAALVVSQRRDRRERRDDPTPRAASLVVTLGRAVGILALLIGLLTAILQP
ncbi:MAG: hypothetical protein M3Y91_08065 [Actinomycetota bacterium]|nr:hypothetical protein [Actinomycetota bacterium]